MELRRRHAPLTRRQEDTIQKFPALSDLFFFPSIPPDRRAAGRLLGDGAPVPKKELQETAVDFSIKITLLHRAETGYHGNKDKNEGEEVRPMI